jgi:hypothetical protein
VARHLFIVSRRDPDLYEYLLTRFKDDDRVEVILDRRHGERQEDPPPVDVSEGRPIDRRKLDHVQRELDVRSHVILTIA